MTNLKSRNLTNTQIKEFEETTEFMFHDVEEKDKQSIFFTIRFGIFQFETENEEISCFGPEGSTDYFAMAAGDTIVFTGSGNTLINTNYKNYMSDQGDASVLPFNKKKEPWGVNRVVKKGKQLWYTTTNTGLWMSEGMHLTNFNQQDSTINNNLSDVCFDEKDHVIFSSNSGEIFIATSSHGAFTIHYRIKVEDGLHGNTISWLVYDPKGYVWAGTNLGINCIDLKELFKTGKKIIRFYDEEEGYSGQNSQKAVIDAKGKIWIAANDQLISLNTNTLLTSNSNQGSLVLQSVEINNKQGKQNIVKNVKGSFTSQGRPLTQRVNN